MIHKYKQNGYNIVLDVNSGSVHLVDNIAYDLLDFVDEKTFSQKDSVCSSFKKLKVKYSLDDLKVAYSELEELYRDGLLFSKNNEKAAVILKKHLENSPVKSMCLNVAHDCNLRCKYCFASTGDFGTGRKLMSLEIAKKAIDFLVSHSGKRHNLEVDFFGGEPLLNFDVVKKTVLYARNLERKHNKNFRFTITTNGLLLSDEIVSFINKEMSNVVLSLDGRKNVNDSMRMTQSNKGSYDVIVPRFKALVGSRNGKNYYVRGTFTNHNLDFSKDVLHINSLGFNQISVEPVISNIDEEFSISIKDLDTIKNEYEKLTNLMLASKKQRKCFNFFHFMVDLENGPCAIKRLKGCSCGCEYVAVTPDGDVFPCHQFVGLDEWKMGSVLNNTFDLSIRKKFLDSNIFTKPDCKDCWAKFYCSGGCNANNFNCNKDILKPNKLACELQKKRLECAIVLQIAQSDIENLEISENEMMIAKKSYCNS